MKRLDATVAALAVGCIVGLGVGIADAAPNYGSMPQTRGRGGGGSSSGGSVDGTAISPSRVTTPLLDAGVIGINAPTGAECVIGATAVDAFRAICLDRPAGASAGSAYFSYNSGSGGAAVTNLVGQLSLTSASTVTVTPTTTLTLSTGAIIGSGGTNISLSPKGTATLNFGSIALGNCADLTITVTGATANTEVTLGVPNAAMVTGSQFQAWVSATDTVSVRHCCVGAATCDPGSGTFAARSFNP